MCKCSNKYNSILSEMLLFVSYINASLFNLWNFFAFGVICVVRPSTKDDTKLNRSNDIVSQSNGEQSNIGSQNGKVSDSEEEEEQEEAAQSNNERRKKRKKKSRQRDKQLLKKEARELRAEVMSQDIELFKFSSVSPEDAENEEVFQNGDSHDKPTNEKASQKRSQTTEDREAKRRKSTNRA